MCKKNTGQELQAQAKINQRQDDIDVQMRDVNRQQSKKIGSLDDENDALSAELDRLSRELDAMNRQTGAEPEPKKDSDSSEKSDTDTRSYGSGTVGSTARAEKTQQRAADAEKRKPEPEPARLKPGSIKPSKTPPVNIGATPAMTMPVVKPPIPTIDVIDEPGTSTAIGQMAKSLSDPAKSPAMGQMAQSLKKPPAIEPIMNPDQALPTRLGQPVDKDAEEVPGNVFQFPNRLSRPDNEPAAMDQPDLFDNPPRTGTYNENKELRRMRELAGLAQ
jgi:regulator of replication initiation timing